MQEMQVPLYGLAMIPGAPSTMFKSMNTAASLHGLYLGRIRAAKAGLLANQRPIDEYPFDRQAERMNFSCTLIA
jgi:hypothetical protein